MARTQPRRDRCSNICSRRIIQEDGRARVVSVGGWFCLNDTTSRAFMIVVREDDLNLVLLR